MCENVSSIEVRLCDEQVNKRLHSDTFCYFDIICLNVLKYVHYSFTLLHIIKRNIQINIYTMLTYFLIMGHEIVYAQQTKTC